MCSKDPELPELSFVKRLSGGLPRMMAKRVSGHGLHCLLRIVVGHG